MTRRSATGGRRRTLACALLLAALASGASAGPAAQADSAADAVAIRERLEGWTADFNAGRADRVCDLFAPDLRANYRGQPEKRFGTLCPALKEALADPRLAYRYELELHEILVDADMAAVRLTWHLTVTDRASGTSEHSSDVGLDVFRRQPDGAWRIARFIAYGEQADE